MLTAFKNYYKHSPCPCRPYHCPSSLSLILVVLILTIVPQTMSLILILLILTIVPSLALLLSLVLPFSLSLILASSSSPVLVLAPRPQVRMHFYDCTLHRKVLEHFIYI